MLAPTITPPATSRVESPMELTIGRTSSSTISCDALLGAVRPGGVVVHVGLQESSGGVDVRRITLSELAFIGVYTYTTADLRASADALHRGALGDLQWVESRPLAEGPAAFRDLDGGRTAAAKIVLLPG